MARRITNRRAMLAGLGTMATAGVLGVRAAEQGAATAAPVTPTLHAEDGWMSALPGKHHVVLDVTSPEHMPDAIRFVGNIFTGHKTGYGVDEADVAIVVCLRHSATAFGYNDAIWSRYGGTLDQKTTPPPTGNPFNSAGRTQLADLAKRGVQFMVCGTASRNLAVRLAAPGGDAEAILKVMAANLIPSARIVAAGVVGVMHAQDRGIQPDLRRIGSATHIPLGTAVSGGKNRCHGDPQARSSPAPRRRRHQTRFAQARPPVCSRPRTGRNSDRARDAARTPGPCRSRAPRTGNRR